MIMKRSLMVAGVCALALAGCAQPMKFAGPITAGQAGTRSAGTGMATATLQPDTKALTYNVEYTGLSGPATAAHFHGPAAPGASAGVVVPFPSTATPIKAGATLTDAQAADLIAGRWYANIHTAANPNGEIRGQMQRTQ